VAKPALGTKRICSGCAAKFYDLDRSPIVCPTCETVFVVARATPQRARSAFDPRSQAVRHMGVLREAEAPGVADEAEVKEEAGEVETIELADEEAGEEAGGVPMLEEIDEK
jgi:uncharacterized protein (TIGR02300 family)